MRAGSKDDKGGTNQMRMKITKIERLEIPPKTRAVKFFVESKKKYSQKVIENYRVLLTGLLMLKGELSKKTEITVQFNRPHERFEVEFFISNVKELNPVGWFGE